MAADYPTAGSTDSLDAVYRESYRDGVVE